MKGEYVAGVLEPVIDELDFGNLAVEGEIPAGLPAATWRSGRRAAPAY
jgi:hypothetical protein